jgi:tRNA A-37 threonylcarbamoyl transferase component Bud32
MKSCPTCQGTYPTHFAVCPQDGTQLVEAGLWAEGSVVRGKYRLLAKIGQGGMGSVYKALHLAFDELRALKVMAPELMADELFVKRFKQEAVITRKLQHPNAVRVDDIDEAEDGRPFIVMEFIEGRSLKDLIREEGPLPVSRVCAISRQVASALDAAHAINMIHRDIKPDNVVLIQTTQGEQAKVLDFGIAKMKEARRGASASMTLTETGMVIGTPQYMSPEQAMGMRGDQLDGRSDLYSLGVVMYQMLTADLPFKADTTMEMILAHLQQPPAPIGATHPELNLPKPLAALVMRLLEKKREGRPASASTLIEEINAAERGVASAPPRLPATKRLTLEEMQPAAPPARPAAAPVRAPTPQAVPRQPQVPAPPAIPARAVPPVAAAPAMVAAPKPSRGGFWVLVALLVVVLGGGGWYFLGRRPRPASQSPGGATQPPASAVQGGKTVPAKSPSSRPASGSAASAPAKEVDASSQPAARPAESSPSEGPSNPPRSEQHAAVPPPKPAVDARKIKGQLTLGDFYMKDGEYDKAIAAYRDGLKLDPGNTELRERIARAQRAKEAERLYVPQ